MNFNAVVTVRVWRWALVEIVYFLFTVFQNAMNLFLYALDNHICSLNMIVSQIFYLTNLHRSILALFVIFKIMKLAFTTDSINFILRIIWNTTLIELVWDWFHYIAWWSISAFWYIFNSQEITNIGQIGLSLLTRCFSLVWQRCINSLHNNLPSLILQIQEMHAIN